MIALFDATTHYNRFGYVLWPRLVVTPGCTKDSLVHRGASTDCAGDSRDSHASSNRAERLTFPWTPTPHQHPCIMNTNSLRETLGPARNVFARSKPSTVKAVWSSLACV